jgi:hypothetical protein
VLRGAKQNQGLIRINFSEKLSDFMEPVLPKGALIKHAITTFNKVIAPAGRVILRRVLTGTD